MKNRCCRIFYISETSQKLALRRLKQLNTNGVDPLPHFMSETNAKVKLSQPLKPIPPISSPFSQDVKEIWGGSEGNTLFKDGIPQSTPTGSDTSEFTTRSSSPAMSKTAAKDINVDENIFTFRPKVSSVSVKIVESLGSDFMSRQKQHLDRQKKFIEQASLHHRNQNVSLSPVTNRSRKPREKVLKEIRLESTNSLPYGHPHRETFLPRSADVIPPQLPEKYATQADIVLSLIYYSAVMLTIIQCLQNTCCPLLRRLQSTGRLFPACAPLKRFSSTAQRRTSVTEEYTDFSMVSVPIHSSRPNTVATMFTFFQA